MYVNIIFILLLLGSLLSATNSDIPDIVIIGSANVHGEIEPCGWKKKPLGGLARKSTIINEIKSEGINPIIVDAGNLFFKNNKRTAGINNDIDKINAEVIVNSFNIIGCEAFAIGENDLSNGLDYLFELKDNASFPFISANIVDKNNELLFEPYVIVERDIDIAFIGLASNFVHSEVSVLDPLTSLSRIVEEVKGKSDLIVLLFNSGNEDVIKLQNSNIDIDLIIRSGLQAKKRSSDGGTKRIPSYSLGDRGKYLYKLNLSLSQSGLPIMDITSQNNIIKNAKKRLDRMKKGDSEVNLKEFYKDDEKTLNRILGYERQLDLASSKLENTNNTIDVFSYELGKDIESDPKVLLIVDKAKEKISLIRGPLPPDSKGRLPGDPHYGHGH